MTKLRIAAVIATAAALGLPATPVSAAKHSKRCHKGYVLKHGKCVKKSKPKPKPPPSLY